MIAYKNPFVKIVVLILFITLLSNCKIVFYGVEQGVGQIKLVNKAVPIKKIMGDTLYADSIKIRLAFVEEVRQYAIDSLGLKKSKNYTTFYDQHGKPIVWIVYAAPKYKMEVHNWKYPVLGKMPYKGYFKQKKARREANKMKEKGFDVRIGIVSAWSTLGYFKDPILSNVLNRSDGELAELIIHELTHATIYVKGEAQFNENLATFIGVNGSKKFLIYKYGKDSEKYAEYIGELNDHDLITNHFLEATTKLDSLYNTFEGKTDTQKDSLKTSMIEQTIINLKDIPFFNTEIPDLYWAKKELINNAFFAIYMTYYMDLSQFEEEFKNEYNSNIKEYMDYITSKYKSV